MQSRHLREYFLQVGEPVHSLNTICVGLSAVETGSVTKPKGLHISWTPHDVQASARKSRRFVIRAAMVFVAEAAKGYIRSLSRVSVSNGWFPKLRDDHSAAERFRIVCRACQVSNELAVAGEMLLRWRNTVVHGGRTQFSSQADRDELLGHALKFHSQYAAIDVQRLIQDFETDSPSLKDASTLMAIMNGIVRRIDERFRSSIDSQERLQDYLVTCGLDSEIGKAIVSKDPETAARKLRRFVSIHVPWAPVKIVEVYIETRILS